MAKSLIRKTQLHPDITDLVGQYGSGYFITQSSGNYFTSGLNNMVTITSNQVISGFKTFFSGIIAPNIVYNTGDQTISGKKTFVLRPLVNNTGFLLSGDVPSFLNLFSTGSTLDNKINSLSGNLTGNYATITNLASTGSTLAINLASTGSTLNTRITNLSGYINSPNSNIVFTTGVQIVSGAKTFFNSGIFSSGVNPLGLPNNPLSVVGSGNNYIQLNIQNRSTGTTATADLVITANNGSDTSNYINLGINNSGYNDPAFSNGSGLDGYLFINGGNLDIGTQTPGTQIEFHAGGTTLNKSVLKIDESGIKLNTGYNLYIPSGSIITGISQYWSQSGDASITSFPINSASFTLEAGRIYRCESFFRFSVAAPSFSDVSKSPANSIYADGYRHGFNNTVGAIIGTPYVAPLSGILVAGIDNGAGGFWGVLSGTNTHLRKAILRPIINSTLTFTYGSHNAASTTFQSGSYILIEKLL